MTTQQEQAIGRDLELISLIMVLGTPKAKRQAKAQHKAIMAHIKQENIQSGFDSLNDDELLRELYK